MTNLSKIGFALIKLNFQSKRTKYVGKNTWYYQITNKDDELVGFLDNINNDWLIDCRERAQYYQEHLNTLKDLRGKNHWALTVHEADFSSYPDVINLLANITPFIADFYMDW